MPIAVARAMRRAMRPSRCAKLAASGREALADGFPDATLGSDKLVIESDGKASTCNLVGLATGTTLATGVQNAIDATLGCRFLGDDLPTR